jgi:hypothetical protein
VIGGARAAWVALALAVTAPAAGAASLTLNDRQQAEALREGQRSVTNEAFGAEWRVVNGPGESVLVRTPFQRLAEAARHAAFRNESVKPQDQKRILRDLRDRLLLEVELRGPRPDFARYFRPRLLVNDREITPVMVQNEHTAAPRDEGDYLARCVYWFPSKDLTATGRMTLVVGDASGQPVTRFPIDLAKMR